jgi:hypothetical protein
MGRLIGMQGDWTSGAEVPVWSDGRPPKEPKPPRARKSDPGTSKVAAAEAAQLAQAHRDIIIKCLREQGPNTKDGIAAKTKLTGVQVGRRLKELCTEGVARKTKFTGRSASGRMEVVHEAVPQ